jgi:hypothetical protein
MDNHQLTLADRLYSTRGNAAEEHTVKTLVRAVKTSDLFRFTMMLCIEAESRGRLVRLCRSILRMKVASHLEFRSNKVRD